MPNISKPIHIIRQVLPRFTCPASFSTAPIYIKTSDFTRLTFGPISGRALGIVPLATENKTIISINNNNIITIAATIGGRGQLLSSIESLLQRRVVLLLKKYLLL